MERYIKLYDATGINDKIVRVSGLFKTVCGIANNCAYLCVLDAMDELTAHPRYKHKLKKRFTDIIEMLKMYEMRLRAGQLFQVKDVIEEQKSNLKESLTNADYFSYWQGLGGAAYILTTDQRNVFLYKAAKAFRAHGVEYADLYAKLLLASKMLYIACDCYKQCIQQALKDYAIHEKWSDECFKPLNLNAIFQKFYETATELMTPDMVVFDGVEDKNIMLASKQLYDKFQSNDFLNDCVINCVKDFDEVFRSKRAKNKIIREIINNKTA